MGLAERILELAVQINPDINLKPMGYQPPPIWNDPRPDLTDDHELWNKLLKLTFSIPDDQQAYEVCGVLHGIRCGGTQLVKSKGGSYKFKPLIDKKLGFHSKDDYDELKEKYLTHHASMIKVLLEALAREVLKQ